MAFVNKKKAAIPVPEPAKGMLDGKIDVFGQKVEKKFLLIPAVILVSGFVLSVFLRSRSKAGSAVSSATSAVQGTAQSVAHATSEAVQPVAEKVREVFRFGN